MVTRINDADVDIVLSLLTGSDGDISLTAERYDKLTGNPYGTTKEYELNARLAGLDKDNSDRLSGKLRSLLTIKLYYLIHLGMQQLTECMGNLKPAELARTNTSMINSFALLTQAAEKQVFDFESEITKLAEEFDLDTSDIRGQLKSMEVKVKTKSS